MVHLLSNALQYTYAVALCLAFLGFLHYQVRVYAWMIRIGGSINLTVTVRDLLFAATYSVVAYATTLFSRYVGWDLMALGLEYGAPVSILMMLLMHLNIRAFRIFDCLTTGIIFEV
jgi:hypothetical protein